jgi:hypothetical protein
MQMSTGAPRPRADVAAVRNRLLTTRIPCDSQRSCAPWVAAWGPSELRRPQHRHGRGTCVVRYGARTVCVAWHRCSSDVGANLGLFGLYAAVLGHRVIFFEPLESNRHVCNTQHVTCDMQHTTHTISSRAKLNSKREQWPRHVRAHLPMHPRWRVQVRI